MATHTRSDNPLHGLDVSDVVDEYRRRDLARLSDQLLVSLAAQIIGVPRAAIADERYSFVLHSPLELMARGALLPYVAPGERERSRLRIVWLAGSYESGGPPLPGAPARHFDSLSGAAAALVDSINHEDLDGVDAAASWLDRRARPDQLMAVLAEETLDRLSAAGHGNIYLALLTRTQPRGLPSQMLRHLARELAKRPSRRVEVPAARSTSDSRAPTRLYDSLVATRVIGPAPYGGIAAMVEHAQEHSALSGLLGDDGSFAAPEVTPSELVGFAAHAMLQGPSSAAPYGWTHCLTLAQAALVVGHACSRPLRAIYVACAYMAAHWASFGQGSVACDWVPEPVKESVAEAMQMGPEHAAAAAWHAPSGAATITLLATSAARAHDAHLVKYTLACLDAAAADQDHAALYLAAAAHLHAWWLQNPDPSDPLRNS